MDNADLSKEDNDLEERVDLESLEFREQHQKADAKAIDTLRESREIRNDGGDEDEGVNLRSGPVLVESIIGQPEDAESALQPFVSQSAANSSPKTHSDDDDETRRVSAAEEHSDDTCKKRRH